MMADSKLMRMMKHKSLPIMADFLLIMQALRELSIVIHLLSGKNQPQDLVGIQI